MKKVVTACSLLSGIIALLALVLGVRAIFGSSDFIVSLAMFRFAANGTFMGFLGNLLSIVIVCCGFGALAFWGFDGSQKSLKKGFGFGVAMTIVCVLSMVISIFSGTFTIGDLFMAALPAVYTYGVLRSA